MKKSFLVLLFSIGTLYGCGTIMHGTTQQVAVSSLPEGAVVKTAAGETCATPCTLTLSRKSDHMLNISKEGFEGTLVPVRHVMSAAAYGNLLFAGVPWGVDAVSGGQFKLVPEVVAAELKPVEEKEVPADTAQARGKSNAAPGAGPASPMNSIPTAAKAPDVQGGEALSSRPYGVTVQGRSDFPVSYRKKAPAPSAAGSEGPQQEQASVVYGATPSRAYTITVEGRSVFPVSYRAKDTDEQAPTAADNKQESITIQAKGEKQ
jgi:hypothetical protein